MRIRPAMVAASAIALQLAQSLYGATDSWTADSGDWATASNWNSGAGPVPGAGDAAKIADSDDTDRVINYDYTGSAITLASVRVDNDGTTGIDTLTMTGVGTLLQVSGSEFIGDSNSTTSLGFGVLVQSVGTNSLTTSTSDLYLGDDADDNGQYSLSGSGILTCKGTEFIGNAGAGEVYQSGGTNNGNVIYLGNASGAGGYYSLSGSGMLSAGLESVGTNNGNGTFIQSGGTNTLNDGTLYIGASGGSGYYSLSAGTLDCTGASGTEYIGDGGPATFVQSGGLSSCAVLTLIGYYSLSAGTLTTTNLGEEIGFSGAGTFVQNGGTNSLTGTYGLQMGYYSDGNGTYSLSAGTITSSVDEDIGYNGTGTFIQTGGTNTIGSGNLVLGYTAGATGIYSLGGNDSTLSVAGSAYVGGTPSGAAGIGTYTQSNGSATVAEMFEIYNASADSSSLSGGSLTVGSLDVNGNPSKFDWTGGTLILTNQTLDINSPTDSNACFGNSLTLDSGMTLIVDGTESMVGATALISQVGGDNQCGALELGNTSDFEDWPIYSLTSGTLTAGQELIGYYATTSGGGSFSQSGGANDPTAIIIDYNSNGAYSLINGTVSADQIYIGFFGSGGGLFMSGGSLTTSETVDNGSVDQTGGTAAYGAVSGTGSLSVGTAGSSNPIAYATVTSISQGSVTVDNRGDLTILNNTAKTGNVINSLTISGNGVMDITNNHFFIEYGSGSDPIATIAGYIKSGFNGGNWNGPGIISSTARTPTNGFKYGVGWADGADGIVSGISSGQIEIKYTLLGDANLDGTVNGSDFSILAANFGDGYTNWDQGNFLFTSSVNGSDFSALAANFGQGDSGADESISSADVAALDAFAAANNLPIPTFASVPEPAGGAIVFFAAAAALKRRRRN
jgi:hypothetical protein